MCFSLEWIKDLLIWIIVLCAVVALIRLLISFVVPRMGLSGEIVSFVVRVLTILFWAIICIAAVVFVFDVIACLMPAMGRIR